MSRLFILAFVMLAGQTAGNRQSFDVVSIKENHSNAGRSGSSYRPGDFYIATNVNLKSMITEAYGIRDFQLAGGPGWIETERFDVQARGSEEASAAGGAQNIDRARILLKLQTLLDDRFHLKIRRESREMPVYALVVGKDGPKLTAAAENKGQPGISMHCCEAGMMELNATGVSVPLLVESLSQMMSRSVIDKTDIKGTFDIKLRWLREDYTPAAAEPEGPSIFTAIQEQLGLKLESTRAPVPMIIIDSVEKPSEN